MNFIHNDVKPANVLIGPRNQGMLTDYGIVGITDDKGRAVLPSGFYRIHAAPEIYGAERVTEKVDIFQAGLTLFRMAVGLDTLQQKFNTLGERAYYAAVKQGNLVSSSDFPAHVPSRLRKIIQKAIQPNLGKRYQSALEMRRELEKLHYPGHWTVTEDGDFVGDNGNYRYRYEMVEKERNKYDIEAFKRYKKTGRETRVREYCCSNVANTIARRTAEKFIKTVVEGI